MKMTELNDIQLHDCLVKNNSFRKTRFIAYIEIIDLER